MLRRGMGALHFSLGTHFPGFFLGINDESRPPPASDRKGPDRIGHAETADRICGEVQQEA